METKNLVTQSFSVISYEEKSGKMCAGYHCHICGKFYATGRFTLETETHTLGNGKTATCCGKEYPLPLTFESVEEVSGFLRTLNKNTATGTPGRLIAKTSLILARFNPASKPPGTTIH